MPVSDVSGVCCAICLLLLCVGKMPLWLLGYQAASTLGVAYGGCDLIKITLEEELVLFC